MPALRLPSNVYFYVEVTGRHRSMFYKLLKIWAQISFRLYFRRIYIKGVEHIPKKGAALFIVNHPSSFLEACIIAAYQHRDLHFLVRGDMFEKKWLLPILKWTNQIPIFRFKDGFGKLRSNKSTFDQSYTVLAEGHALLLFPEASSELVKYLRPLQKGAARLAIGTLEERNVEELYVIPCGIYYTDPTRSRTTAYLEFGKALTMRSWYDENRAVEDKLGALTAHFQNAMQEVVPSVTHPDLESVYDLGYALAEKDIHPLSDSGLLAKPEAFAAFRQFLERLNQLGGAQLIGFEKHIQEYRSTFRNLFAFDAAVKYERTAKLAILLAACLYFITALPACLVYGLPLAAAKAFSKAKIRHVEFYAPVRIAISMGIHLLLTVILFIAMGLGIGWITSLVVIVLLQVSLYSLGWFRDYAKYPAHFFNSLIRKNKPALRAMRERLACFYR
ncbi:MAG TPA: 1-acyl-sn-glycerol-3-phosphate acyltransferase [Saprospiraceae bacterium]|nr:1-acyl-sn-glycerol-3-phosphate acyltransferase [Saprospiraceae bacterium]